LFNNGGAGSLWWLPEHRGCFFDADGVDAAGTLGAFLTLWNEHQTAAGGDRLIILPSSDHDYSRLVCGTRTAEQLGAAFTFLLTWGSVPSLYYGDEIGMRYLDGLPDHEGSVCFPGYNRAGCRTPMQWDNAQPNAGFSTAPPERLYLPQDPSRPRPDVAAQRDDPDSPLSRIRRLIQLRRTHSALRAGTATQVVTTGYPFAYLRGDSHLVVVNPARHAASARPQILRDRAARPLEVTGVRVNNEQIDADGFGYGVFALD
jgi:glycosidase